MKQKYSFYGVAPSEDPQRVIQMFRSQILGRWTTASKIAKKRGWSPWYLYQWMGSNGWERVDDDVPILGTSGQSYVRPHE